MTNQNLKIVAIGDGVCNKTLFLFEYVKGKLPTEYVPTVFDNYTAKMKINNQQYSIQLWDTSGQEQLENVRALSYANTSIFLFFYSTTSKTTLDNLFNFHYPDIASTVKKDNICISLIGVDKNKRDAILSSGESNNDIVLEQEGKDAAKRLNAIYFSEIDISDVSSVQKALDDTLMTYVSQNETKKKCRI